MNPLRAFLLLLASTAALAGTARAQLVHLTATQQLDGGGGLLFRATDATIPWNHTGGFISRLDIYYDLNDVVTHDGFYTFSNPDRNVWRAKVHIYDLGDYEIIRPLQTLSVGETEMRFEYDADFFEEFDVTFQFATPRTELTPPVPPIEFGEVSYFLQGTGFFNIPDLSEAYGGAIFETSSAGFAQTVDFTPVPEPGTYAAGAALLLGLVVWLRRRSTNTTLIAPAA